MFDMWKRSLVKQLRCFLFVPVFKLVLIPVVGWLF
jgi:hypothetical protein